MPELLETFNWLIGPDSKSLAWWQMVFRSVVVFFFGLLLIRLGARRMFGRNTPFDVVLAIAIGSLLSRAITGGSAFFGTLAVVIALVALHWSVAVLSYFSDAAGFLAKGERRELVKNGKINWRGMRRGKVGEKDLLEALRLRGVTDVGVVKQAHLERGGEISVIPRSARGSRKA